MDETTTPQPPEGTVFQLLNGAWVAQAIHAACELGVPDALGDGPATVDAIAEKTGTHAPSLARLLRALAGVGLCVEDESGRVALTPAGATLRAGVPGSTRGLALFWKARWHERAWEDLAWSVRTGEPAFDHVHGAQVFDWLRDRPDDARVFNDAMTSISAQSAAAVAARYSFADVRTLVDVGGGHGFLLATLLRANAHLRGILFDQPQVTAGAPALLADMGVHERVEVRSGSFFDAVPEGGDAYVLKHIIHDWDDERAAAILSACRRAMAPGARLLIVDHVIPPGNDPHFGKLLDLEMLVMTPKGKERTAEEFRALLRQTGFTLTRIVPTANPVCVIEGRPT